MEANKNLPTDILDIIFDQRNKEYGAYELRKNYERRAKRAVFGMLIFSFVAVSIPLLAGIIGGKTVRVNPPFISDTIVFKQIEQQQAIQKKQQAQNIKPTTKSTSKPNTRGPIEVVEASQVPRPSDPIVKPNDDLPSTNTETGDVTSNKPTGFDNGNDHGGVTIPTTVEPDPELIYKLEEGVEEYPEYPGGEDALIAYLSSKIKYPAHAIANNIEGRVVLGFVVNKNGEIDELKVVRSLGYGCDEEAMRVVRSMPLWKPGKNNKKPVRVYFNLPIEFQIAQ